MMNCIMQLYIFTYTYNYYYYYYYYYYYHVISAFKNILYKQLIETRKNQRTNLITG
jgi:hypothetical protein